MTYAIVKAADGSTYVSPLFAIKFAGGESAAIGLDASMSYVQKLAFWQNVREEGCPYPVSHRSLFIVANEYGDAQKKWSGMDWLMKDQGLMERLLTGDRIPLTEDSRFAPYAAPITLPAWFEVNTPTDAASLETVSFHFHDAEPIACTKTDTDLTVTLDTTWGCIITVRFCGVTEDTFTGRVGCILDSHVEKTAEGVIFTVLNGYGGWIDGIEFDTPAENAFVRCQRILWQIRID